MDEQEARNRAAEIMIEDFNNRGGQVLEYAAQEKGRLDHTVLEIYIPKLLMFLVLFSCHKKHMKFGIF